MHAVINPDLVPVIRNPVTGIRAPAPRMSMKPYIIPLPKNVFNNLRVVFDSPGCGAVSFFDLRIHPVKPGIMNIVSGSLGKLHSQPGKKVMRLFIAFPRGRIHTLHKTEIRLNVNQRDNGNSFFASCLHNLLPEELLIFPGIALQITTLYGRPPAYSFLLPDWKDPPETFALQSPEFHAASWPCAACTRKLPPGL